MTSDTVVQDEPLHFASWAYTAVSDGRLTSQALTRLLTLKSFYHAAVPQPRSSAAAAQLPRWRSDSFLLWLLSFAVF